MFTVHVASFSYAASGYPVDEWGHGGGFVFDCRCLPNPGRLEGCGTLTGRDEPVIRYLRDESRVEEFLNPISRVVDIAVASYKARGFEHLSVAFGCTGGQHRSVYCAEWLAHRLRRAGETVTITHGSPAMAGVNAVRDMSDHAV